MERNSKESDVAPIDDGFRDAASLTNWVRIILYIHIVVGVVSIASNYVEYQFYSDLRDGVYASEEQAAIDAEANDERQGLVAAVGLLVFVVGGVVILKWIHRANYNARQLGAENLRFTPGWSVGWFFVPIANLWKPYQAMKEIWLASQSPADWSGVSRSPLLPEWWFLWLANGFVGQTILSASLRAETLDELLSVNYLGQGSEVIAILLYVVTLALVNSVFRAQMQHAASGALSEVAFGGEESNPGSGARVSNVSTLDVRFDEEG